MNKRGFSALLTLDVAFLCAMAIIGVGFIWDSQRLSAMAATLPQYTAIVMIALILFVLYGKAKAAFRPSAPAQAKPAEPAEAESAAPAEGRKLPWFVTWILIATYPFLVLTVGFSLGTLVFLTGLSILMGTRPSMGVVYGVVGTAAMIVLFIYVLKVPMPDSALGELVPALHGF